MAEDRVPIPGSEPKHPAASRRLYAADPEDPVQATIVLRRPGGEEAREAQARALLAGQFQTLSRETAGEQGGDPADVASVEQFAQKHGLSVLEESAPERTVRIAGTVKQMDDAFGVHLEYYEDEAGGNYMSWAGPLSAPASVAGAITAVLGLDQREVARRQ